jgi:hypothetical protein
VAIQGKAQMAVLASGDSGATTDERIQRRGDDGNIAKVCSPVNRHLAILVYEYIKTRKVNSGG